MSLINYDLSELIGAIEHLKSNQSLIQPVACDIIRKELDKLFGDDAKCTNVTITNNTDKEFFGIVIKPITYSDKSQMSKNLFKDDFELHIKSYSVEFDSKIFDPEMDMINANDIEDPIQPGTLTSAEICSLLLYDINEICGVNCMNSFRDALFAICSFRDIVLDKNKFYICDHVFEFIVMDTIRNLTSIFAKPSFEMNLSANDFIKGYGLEEFFNSATQKLSTKYKDTLKDQIPVKAMSLNWYVGMYKRIDSNCRYCIQLMRKMVEYTPSKSYRVSLINAIKDLEEITSGRERYYNQLTESTTEKKKMSLFSKLKYNGLRSIEDDLYEFNMRIRNVETESDALLLMRQINNRMEILDDYIKTEELSDPEESRWWKLLDKYSKLREELSKKSVYNRKMYGLFVDYNALQNMSNNQLLNTYY